MAHLVEPTKVAVLTPERRVLTDNFDGKPLGRLNDLVADKKGGAFFTSGGAYYVNSGGRVTSLGDDIRANGIMLNRDETIVYVTNGAVVLAFDIQPDGAVTNRREFGRLQAGGSGDGMAIDAAGRLYVTSNAGVQVFSDGGAVPRCDSGPEKRHQRRFSRRRQEGASSAASGALGPDGEEFVTRPKRGIRNNAKTSTRFRCSLRVLQAERNNVRVPPALPALSRPFSPPMDSGSAVLAVEDCRPSASGSSSDCRRRLRSIRCRPGALVRSCSSMASRRPWDRRW